MSDTSKMNTGADTGLKSDTSSKGKHKKTSSDSAK
jgi:hypothetical protein